MKAYKAVLFMAAIALTGCNDIEVVNGEIPAEHVKTAETYMGIYQGRFDGRRGDLKLSLDGRRVKLEFDGLIFDDLLPGCRAKIGNLQTVGINEKNKKAVLRRAKFELDPGKCWAEIEGRNVQLEFFVRSGREMIDASVLKETRWETICWAEGGDPSRGIPPKQQCRNEAKQIWLAGRFSR